MKKIIMLGLLLAMTSVSFAQVVFRPQVGVNFASFTNDLSGQEWAGKSGFQYGLDFIIGQTFYIQPGVNYQTTKLKIKGHEGIQMKASRINVPLAIGFKFYNNENTGLGMRAYAGPNLSVNMNADVAQDVVGITADDVENIHLSGIGGLGFDIGMFFVDFTYQFGMQDYINNTTLNQNTKMNTFNINGGLRINL